MKRGKFNLSHYKVLSFDPGELVPIGIVETLPGDTFWHSTSALLRMSPMLAPVMHPEHARIHHWFVPTRLVWDGFQDFITGGPDGNNAAVVPTMAFTGAAQAAVGSLADYLGIPTAVDVTASALPFRACALIFNEWYRDQDLVSPLAISKADGADTTTSRVLQRVAWEKDYFTSARPWAQKGPQISIPLVGNAPVSGLGYATSGSAGTGAPTTIITTDPSETFSAGSPSMGSQSTLFARMQSNAVPSTSNRPQIFANLSSLAGISVTALRQALGLQRFQEMRARYGSRYVEYLAALGVKSSDARLQRPEYLGGGQQTIQFSEVLATGGGASAPAVGDLKGHGIGAMRSNKYKRFFEEHGYVISFLSVKPRTMYVQGLPRMWSRTSKEMYWQPELEHIGQQQILNKEVYAQHTTPDGVFGYQDRYDEYRRQESTIAGEFRTTALDFWHMARIFASDPALNSTFVQANPTKRNYASQTTDVIYAMANHRIQARRALSQKGTSYIF